MTEQPKYNPPVKINQKELIDFLDKMNKVKTKAIHCKEMPDSQVKMYGFKKESYY